MRRTRMSLAGFLAVGVLAVTTPSAQAQGPGAFPGCYGQTVASRTHNSGGAGASGNPKASAGPGYFLGPNTGAVIRDTQERDCTTP
jgi:hypothetical protein